MFKKTITFSDLKADPSTVAELEYGEAVQVFHRGQSVKVMITQDYFFNLLEKLESGNEIASVKKSFEELRKDVANKLHKVNDLVGKS